MEIKVSYKTEFGANSNVYRQRYNVYLSKNEFNQINKDITNEKAKALDEHRYYDALFLNEFTPGINYPKQTTKKIFDNYISGSRGRRQCNTAIKFNIV